jgi:hypothetical protein
MRPLQAGSMQLQWHATDCGEDKGMDELGNSEEQESCKEK